MRLFSVATNEYDADIEKLLSRRLIRHGLGSLPVESGDGGKTLTFGVENEDELRALSAALAELMLIDLRYFEIAGLVDRLPFALEDKKRILPKALEFSGVQSDCGNAADAIFDYFHEYSLLNLAGYLRFRLRDVLENWSVCVDAAAEEQLLSEEFEALTSLLGLFGATQTEASGDVSVILNPDGSCTIRGSQGKNKEGFRIDCAPDSNEGVLNILSGLTPERILLYDFSFGRCDKLRAGIELLFGARITEKHDQ